MSFLTEIVCPLEEFVPHVTNTISHLQNSRVHFRPNRPQPLLLFGRDRRTDPAKPPLSRFLGFASGTPYHPDVGK